MPLPILCILENTARYQCRHVTTQGSSATTRDRGSTGAGPRRRQVIEYASQDAATPTTLPSATPIPLSHLSLQESAGDMLLAAVPRPESSPPHPYCSYDLGANDSPTASPLLTPVPHLLRESYDDSYDMSV